MNEQVPTPVGSISERPVVGSPAPKALRDDESSRRHHTLGWNGLFRQPVSVGTGAHPAGAGHRPRRLRIIAAVAWYGWLILVIVVLALVALIATLVQRQRRAGGVLSVGSRPRRRKR
jgi:hypothetical protein